MQLVFIIAIMFLGITTAQGQTVLQLNGQTNTSQSAVGSDPLSVPTSSLPSVPASGPLNGWGLGKPGRNSRRVAQWMLWLEKHWSC
jgi:hypothetical protein